MSALLEASGLHAYYGPAAAVRGLDFCIQPGGITALLGANGAGKTTTLRALCGLVRTRGQVRLDGERIDGKATEDIVRRGVGHVPEGRGTFSRLTVAENLKLATYTRKDRGKLAADFERVFSYFPVLHQRRGQQAGTLSGGEQQMLAVARALMLRPRLLLLDEPSFGLAPVVVQSIFAILRAINSEENMTMLLVEQNASMALELADRAYVLETGTIVLSGTVEEIRQDESVRSCYLGY